MIEREQVVAARAIVHAVDFAELEEILHEEWRRRAERREERERRRGRPRAVNCFICGRFKSRPSSICDFCGDVPGTHNGDSRVFDEAYYGERVL